MANLIPLTDDELQVLDIFARGNALKNIPRMVGASEATVRRRLENVYRKLGVHGLVPAIRAALREGYAVGDFTLERHGKGANHG